MEIKYQLFETDNLLIQKYSGSFSIEYYKRFAGFIIEITSSKPIKKVLIDFRSLIFSDFPFDLSDDFNDKLDQMVKFRKKIYENELKNKASKLVIWVDKPIPTVIAHLFTLNFSNRDYSYCSSSENVIELLKLPEHFKNLNNIVNNLENTF
jgi:hypothetical protein